MTNLASVGSRPRGVEGRSFAQDMDKPAEFVPGQPDMWAFVLFEGLVFTS